ncbi:hypothetical protein BHU62_04955 [Serratia marcescens]|uniref:Pirin N-terminal domain-containing protein n=2 Tax=Serratia marcescens TaxID=615 RepID=A0A1Q4P4C7_SERMA|nr:hypothetical protein BHU62_04955 [Serratia marcescens]
MHPATGSEMMPRAITHRTKGQSHGPITRLMSPSDLGQIIKPFVFLDLFDVNRHTAAALADMPLHPHSGVATVTVPVEGGLRYNDPDSGQGTLYYGGVEWMLAGGGVWHGKELSPADVPRITGFQLWLSLPAELENSTPVSRYIEAEHTPQVGPARVIVGAYDGAKGPVSAPAGINYLLVTLSPGEHWHYQPPAGHRVGWLALAKGSLNAETSIEEGEIVVFESNETPISLANAGSEEATFVLGSAIPHPYSLHLGNYSVHTSAAALEMGERHIIDMWQKLKQEGDRQTSSGTIPVYR